MAEEKTHVQSVVIAVDGSKEADKALHYYAESLHRPLNDVILVHCMEIPYMAGHPTHEELGEMLTKKRAHAKEVQEKAEAYLKSKGIEPHFIQSDFDPHPGQVVLDAAARKNATLIVMGTRGMGTVRRTVMGSVSNYVLHHAKCPVTICRT